MRKLLLFSIALVVLALGIGGGFLVLSPGAGAHGLVDGTFNGNVGTSANHDAFTIALNAPANIAPGTYQLNITDYATIHNFDLCKGSSCTGSNSLDKTDIAGTGTVQWLVNLTAGTYTIQCDAHNISMQEQFTVGATPPVTVKIGKVVATRRLVTANAFANQPTQFKAWLLKGTTQLATTTAPGTTATLKLKPLKALKPGTYVVQVRATSGASFATARKKIVVS